MSLSDDGNVIAIGAPGHDHHVHVYKITPPSLPPNVGQNLFILQGITAMILTLRMCCALLG